MLSSIANVAIAIAGLASYADAKPYPRGSLPRGVFMPGYTASVPQIPDQFIATVSANTTGTLQGLPYGLSVTTQYYDYTNKRERYDFDDGTSKMYDYKTLMDPGMERNPKFPSPQGFKFNTDNIKNSCCWVWLIDDDTKEPEIMQQYAVEKNAQDVGKDADGEHWASVLKFPFLQTDDWWFTQNDTVAKQNSYFNIPGTSSISGWVMTNATFKDVKYGPIDDSVFAHPDSRPTFGQCKQCGVDPDCPMWLCQQ